VSGAICLAGGAEFLPRCRALDEALLARAGGGPVVVAPLANAVGLEYLATGANGKRWFASLGVPDVRVAPDAREDPDGAVRAVADAALLVFPGGSPARLLEALTGTPMGQAVAGVPARGGVVCGAGAGAMVLGGWTLLPEGHAPDGPPLVEALGLVPDVVVLPHFRGDREWVEMVRRRLGHTPVVLGLPECAGVLVDGGRFTAVGAVPVTVFAAAARTLGTGESWGRGDP
jgi:cyanophycinase-like exopeptidase